MLKNLLSKKFVLTTITLLVVFAIVIAGVVFAVQNANDQEGRTDTVVPTRTDAGVHGSMNYIVGKVGVGYSSSAETSISTAADFASTISNANFSGSAKLTTDITLTSTNQSSLFGIVTNSGTFDGQGHTITLSGDIARSYASGSHYSAQYTEKAITYVGLFGGMGNGATVKNVTIVVDGSVTLTSNTASLFASGLIFGWGRNATIENVKIVIKEGATFKAVETLTDAGETALGLFSGIGGHVGYGSSSYSSASTLTLNNCQAVIDGSLILQHASCSTSNQDHVALGGLIGKSDKTTFNGCGLFGKGKIDLQSATSCWTGVGGFIGFMRASSAKGNSQFIFNSGTAEFSGSQFIGYTGTLGATNGAPSELRIGIILGDGNGLSGVTVPTVYSSYSLTSSTKGQTSAETTYTAGSSDFTHTSGYGCTVTVSSNYTVAPQLNFTSLTTGEFLMNPLYTASSSTLGSPAIYYTGSNTATIKGLASASGAAWSGNGYATLSTENASFSFVTDVADQVRVGEVSSSYVGSGTEISSWSSYSPTGNIRLSTDVTADSFKTGNFSGTFDGQGHTVYVSSISQTFSASQTTDYSGGALTHAGLLGGRATGGTVKNLKIVIKSGTSITATSTATSMFAAGLLFGWAENVTIQNVQIVVEEGATFKAVETQTAAGETALGLVAGIGGEYDDSTSLVMKNVQIVLNGSLILQHASCDDSTADHIGLGGFVGKSDKTTFDGCGLFGKGKIDLQSASSCWTGVGGFIGFMRTSTASGKNSFTFNIGTAEFSGSQFIGYTGTIGATNGAPSELRIGIILGDGNGQGGITVPTVYSTYALKSATKGQTSAETTYTAGSSDFTHTSGYGTVTVSSNHTIDATDAVFNGKFSPSLGFSEGLVATYIGDLAVVGISAASGASYIQDGDYVALQENADSAFTWTIYEYEYSWDAGKTVEEAGSVYTGYSADKSAYVQDISTVEQWKNVFINGNGTSKYYRLTADLEITDFQGSDVTFTGYLDGQGHTVTLKGTSWSKTSTTTIGNTSYTLYGGVAGINQGTIRNLKIALGSDITVASGNNVFGGVVAKNSGTIENVSVFYNGTTTVPGGLVGGIVGFLDGGTINYVKAEIDGTLKLTTSGVTCTLKNLGGIVGYSSGGIINLATLKGNGTLTSECTTDTWLGKIIAINQNGVDGITATATKVLAFIDAFKGTFTYGQTSASATLIGTGTGSYNITLYTLYNLSYGSAPTKMFIDTDTAHVVMDTTWDGTTPTDETTSTTAQVYITYTSSGVVKASFSDESFSYDAKTYDGKRVYFSSSTFGTYQLNWLETLDSTSFKSYLQDSGTVAGGMKALGEDVAIDSTFSIGAKTVQAGSGIDGAGMTVTIKGDLTLTDTGIFGAVNNGTLQNINIVVEGNLTLSGSDSLGLVTAENQGTISRVSVTVKGSVIMSDATNIGLVVGKNTGSVNLSSVTVSGTAKLQGTTLNAGGLVGQNSGSTSSVTNSTLTVSSGSTLYADGTSTLNFGGIVGSTDSGTVSGNTSTINGTLNANSSTTSLNATTVNEGGLIGYISNATAKYNTIEGSGQIAINGNNLSGMAVGSAFGYASGSSTFAPSLLYTYTGTQPIFDAGSSAKQGQIIGNLNGTDASVSVYYYNSGKITNFIGNTTDDSRVDHNRVDSSAVSDVILSVSGTTDSTYQVIATSTKPFYGIKNEHYATYDKNLGAVIISQSTGSEAISWKWVDSYDGNTILNETVVYGSDYMTLTVPTYTDGYMTDYGRIIAGYGIVSTAFKIENKTSLNTWLGITKTEVDGNVLYQNGSTSYTKDQYEYAYLSADISIDDTVFFNTQGVLAEDRTLDGAGHTISSTKNDDSWSGTNNKSAYIIGTGETDLLAEYGLTKLASSTSQPVAITSGLMAVNKGTIKNVIYKVPSGINQFTNDAQIGTSSVGATGINWIHGFVCGINKGTIENVSVIIGGDVRLHTNSNGTHSRTYLMGGVTGYNYGGTISYASTTVNGTFNHSPRGGAAMFGGVVGFSSGGTLEYLKFDGTGTVKLNDLRMSNASTSDFHNAYYMGGILGAGNNTTTTAVYTLQNIESTRTKLQYFYNGFTGTYLTDKGSGSTDSIQFGLIAGRVTYTGGMNASSNPLIKGVMFIEDGTTYQWAKKGTSVGSYTYSNISGKTLTPFGGIDCTVASCVFSGAAIKHFTAMAYNGYFDYWTRKDSNNNGFAVEFSSPALLNSVTVSGVSGVSYKSDEYRVYFPSSVISSQSSSFLAETITPTLKTSSGISAAKGFYDYGKATTTVTSGTAITSSTYFPLSGSDTYYLTGNTTVSLDSYFKDDRYNASFSGKIYGNGYTLTLQVSGEKYKELSNSCGSSGVGDGGNANVTQGWLITNFTSGGLIQDLNIVISGSYYQTKQRTGNLDKASENQHRYTGLIGSMVSGTTITNCTVTNSGTIGCLQGNTAGNRATDYGRLSAGSLVGFFGGGTISKVKLNMNGGTVRLNGYHTSKDYKPDGYAGGLVGYMTGGTLSEIILTGTGTISASNCYGSTACALVGKVTGGTIKNIFLNGCSYTRTIAEQVTNDGTGLTCGGSSSGLYYFGTSNQDTSSFGGSWTPLYYSNLLTTDLTATATVSTGLDASTFSGSSASMYVDWYAGINNSDFKAREYYAVRNKHRGNFFWAMGETEYVTQELSSGLFTINTADHNLHNALKVGTKTRLMIVDGQGHIVDGSSIRMLESRYYDGTNKAYASFDTIEEAINIGLITSEQVSYMTDLEKEIFLQNKYQYSYQIFDLSGTTPLTYSSWAVNNDYSELEKGITLTDIFPSDTAYTLSSPSAKTVGSTSYYLYNQDALVLAKTADTTLNSYSQRIKSVGLIATPAYSTTFSEESTVSFFIPLGEDDAINALKFWSSATGGKQLLATKYYETNSYSSAGSESAGGITYTFNTEDLRGGTTYYVEGQKQNSAGDYITVTGRVSVKTMIDTKAPIIGILNSDGSVRTDITADDVTYVDDDGDGVIDYGKINLYVKDVSMTEAEMGVSDTSGYTISTSPLTAAANLSVSYTEDKYGILYEIILRDSANITFRATDGLDRTTTAKFAIDIVAPSLIVNAQISTYDTQKFINNPSHKIYISSITDNLTGQSALKSSLTWEVYDLTTSTVIASSTTNGQNLGDDLAITLPLKDVYSKNARIRVTVKDECNNATTYEEDGVLIDTREYRVYYGESLITKENISLTASPVISVNYGTGGSAILQSDSKGYWTLHRFDSFSVQNVASRSGLTYLGFGMDVDYYTKSTIKDLDLADESLEIAVKSNQTITLDGNTYGSVDMSAPSKTMVEVKAIFFYTVALDIQISLDSVIETEISGSDISTNGIVKSISRTVSGSTSNSAVVTPSNFTNYINMEVKDEDGNDVSVIKKSEKGSYTITFSVRNDLGFDNYYTIGSTSSVFTVNVITATDEEVSFSLGEKDTVSLTYGTTTYGGQWGAADSVYDSSYKYGWSISTILDEMYKAGDLVYSGNTSVYDEYTAKYGHSMFSDLKYTVIKSGAVVSSDIVDTGTYNVTVQFKSKIDGVEPSQYTYRGSKQFTVKITPSSFTVSPYSETTTYGDAIDSLGYDVDWQNVSPRDKVKINKEYSLNSTTGEVYYIASTGAHVKVGRFVSSENVVKLFEGTTYEKSYSVVSSTSTTVTISTFEFREGVISTAPISTTTRRNAGEYVGTDGIILSGGSSQNYNILIDRAGDLTIEKRSITVKIIDKVKYYNQEDPAVYDWELTSGSFGYTDGMTDFTTNITREQSSTGTDQVGTHYVLSGTVQNDNYIVTVQNGVLSVEALTLEYFVSGDKNMYYGTTKDYFGTFTVKVVNAKRDDNVTAVIYYLLGYTSGNNPIYIRKEGDNYVGLNATATDAMSGVENGYFKGKLTTSENEAVATHKIEWVKQGSYAYRVVASSTDENFSQNYTNATADYTASITGLKLYVVASDQIVVYKQKIDSIPKENVNYTLEGVDTGDTVTVSGLNISTISEIGSYGYGKHVGQITVGGLSYTSSKGLTYEIVYVYGSLTVEKATVNLTWNAVNSQVYTGSSFNDYFTSSVKADNNLVDGRLSFEFYDASGNRVTEIKNAGGYYIRAYLPTTEYLDYRVENFKLDTDDEYFYVNIDKQSLYLEAFGEKYWNSRNDTSKNTTNNYKRFVGSYSLSSILKEATDYLLLKNYSGGTVNSYLASDFSTWQFVVSSETGSASITYNTYGGSSANVLPSTALNGTYEVKVIVPESVNYYGLTERVMFKVTSSENNVTYWSSTGKKAGGYYTISKSSVSLSNLSTNAGYIAGHGSNGTIHKDPNGSTGSMLKSNSSEGYSPEWSLFYINIELSDEYYMLALQGKLRLTVSGAGKTYREYGTAYYYNNTDGLGVVVRGIGDAQNYSFGSASGESSIDPSSTSITKNNVFGTVSGLSNTYGSSTVVAPSTGNTVTQNFSLSWTPSQSSYRIYFLGWAQAEDYCTPYTYALVWSKRGWLDYEYSGLQISAEVLDTTASTYSQATLDKSTTSESQNTISFNKSTASSTVLNTTSKFFVLSGTTYYYNGSTVYYDAAKQKAVEGWSVNETTNLIQVTMRTVYNASARSWRFVVGSESAVGINPSTFSIKVRRLSGVETWSVKTGEIYVTDISSLYNKITFETRLLPDDVVSMTAYSIQNYAGTTSSISGSAVLLDNNLTGATDNALQVSTSSASGYTDFEFDKWYKSPQYLAFKVQEDTTSGFSGLDENDIKVYYFNASGVKTYISSQKVDTETSSGIVTAINMRTTAVLDTCGYYYIEAQDKQGNIVVYTFYFHYDPTTEANLTLTIDPDGAVKTDTWYSDNVEIIATVNIDFDNNIDLSIGKIQYLATASDVYSDGTYSSSAYTDKWRSMTLTYDEKYGYNSKLTLTDSSETYLVFRYLTGAGNVIYKNLGLVKIDKQEPEIGVTVASPSTDELVLSGKWTKGDVSFYITGLAGISGGVLEYTTGGKDSTTWYNYGSASQPATFTYNYDKATRLYTAEIRVSTQSYIKSNYAIRFRSDNGKTVYAVFSNGTENFNLSIDNVSPIVKADSVSWQSSAQDALINIQENESGIGSVVVEEIDKSTGEAIAYFTEKGAYQGKYSDRGTTPYLDIMYDILTIADYSVMTTIENTAYNGRVFQYTGDTQGTFTKNKYYKVDNGTASELTVTTVDNATTLNSLLTSENVGKYYYYTGTNSGDFVEKTLYRVEEKDGTPVFTSLTIGSTRTVTVSGGSYYFKFGEYKYALYVEDNVGNTAEATYTPKVDTYMPTLSVVAIAYDDYESVDFAYNEDSSYTTADIIAKGIKVYMNGDSTTPSYYVLLVKTSTDYKYYVTDGSTVEQSTYTDKVTADKSSFTYSPTSAHFGEITSIDFYPHDARIEVFTRTQGRGHGVDPEYLAENNVFSTKTVRFIVAEWTVGASGGILYYSNGTTNVTSGWKVIERVQSFDPDLTYKDLSNQKIYFEASTEGQQDFTFFYRSVSNIIVYYNYTYHRSEKSSTTAIAGKEYNFSVNIDRTRPEVTGVEYNDGQNWQSNLQGKTDWWTYKNGTDGMKIRFTVSDLKSGINLTSGVEKVYVTDKNGTETILTLTDGYYEFTVKETSSYVITAIDKVGNVYTQTLTQAGGQDIKVDLTVPTLTVTVTSGGTTYTDGTYATADVIFDIDATFGNSGGTIYVQLYDEDTAEYVDVKTYDGLAIDPTFEITEFTDGSKYRVKAVSGAGIELVSKEYLVKLDKIAPIVEDIVTYKAGTKDITDDALTVWTTEAVDVSFTVSDLGTGVDQDKVELAIGTGEYQKLTPTQGKYYITDIKDTTPYRVRITDRAGNTQVYTYEFLVDAKDPELTAPEFTFSDGTSYTLGSWSTQSVIATFYATFAVSNPDLVGTIEYQKDGGQWQVLTDTAVEKTADGKYKYVYTFTDSIGTYKFRAHSLAGKMSAVSEEYQIKVDAVIPSATVEFDHDFDLVPWATDMVTATVTAQYGVSGASVLIYKDGVLVHTETCPDNAKTYTFNYEIATTEKGTYKFVVKNNQNIESDAYEKVVRFDTTYPTISYATTYAVGTWTNTDVTFDVKISVGDSYQKMSYFVKMFGEEEKCLFYTDMSATFMNVDTSITDLNYADGFLTFKYTIKADASTKPVVMTSFVSRVVVGNGRFDRNASYEEENSVLIDKFTPTVSLVSMKKSGLDTDYTENEWSMRQIEFTFSVTYYQSGATLRYSLDGTTFNTDSIVRKGTVQEDLVEIDGTYYNKFTVTYVYTVSTDLDGTISFKAESGAGTETDIITKGVRYDRIDPSISTITYLRADALNNYTDTYNPEIVGTIADEKVKVSFTAQDVSYGGVLSGISSVTVTKDGTPVDLNQDGTTYWFFVTDSNAYQIIALDNSGRTTSRTIKIGVDSIKPDLKVAVNGSYDDGKGYSFTSIPTSWATAPLTFDFFNTTYGTSGMTVKYSFNYDSSNEDGATWYVVDKSGILTLKEKITYEDHISFVAVSGAGLKSEIVTVNLKLDMREYTMTVKQYVGSHVGSYALVEVLSTKSTVFTRMQQITLGYLENSGYTYNYRIVNGERIDLKPDEIDKTFTVTVGSLTEGKDLNIEIFFKETVYAESLTDKITQYIKGSTPVDPVKITDSNKVAVNFVPTYTSVATGNTTTDIEEIGTTELLPLGKYTLTLQVIDTSNYILSPFTQEVEILYFDTQGTEDDPYRIYNAQDLSYMSASIYNLAEKYFVLASDIVLDAITTSDLTMKSNLDGRNYTISYSALYTTNQVVARPIFAIVEGTIKNLGIKTGSVTMTMDGATMFGVLTNVLKGTVKNSFVVTDITFAEETLSQDTFIGGLVATTESGAIIDTVFTDAYIDAKALKGSVNIGGIAGKNTDTQISSSFSIATLFGSSTAKAYMISDGITLSPITSTNRLTENKVVDGNIYLGGEYQGETGNVTYYELYTALTDTYGNFKITLSSDQNSADMTSVKDLVKDRFDTFGQNSYDYVDGNIRFEIKTEQDFRNIDKFLWADYIQTADLTITEKTSVAKGGLFRGTYDGGGRKITYSIDSLDDDYALFDKVSGTIKNVYLQNIEINAHLTSSDKTVASLVRELEGGTVESIVSGGSIQVSTLDGVSGIRVSALVGISNGGTIRNVVTTAYVKVEGDGIIIGAVVGEAINSTTDGLYAVSTVNSIGNAQIGSIIGRAENTVFNKGYAFDGNAYQNGATVNKFVGNMSDTDTTYEYTTITKLMDKVSGYIIMNGEDVYTGYDVFVSDALEAMFEGEFESGIGTIDDPFVLSKKEDFAKISRYMYAHYKIDLGGKESIEFADGEWTTIGVGMNFTGSITGTSYYDTYGYPHTITLSGINGTFVDKNMGTISNFKLVGYIDEVLDGDSVYGIVANVNQGTIEKIEVATTVYLTVKGSKTLTFGALAGENSGTIAESSVTINGTVKSYQVTIGGIVGNSTAGTLKNNSSYGDLTVYSSRIAGKATVKALYGAVGTSTITRIADNKDVLGITISVNETVLDSTENAL